MNLCEERDALGWVCGTRKERLKGSEVTHLHQKPSISQAESEALASMSFAEELGPAVQCECPTTDEPLHDRMAL